MLLPLSSLRKYESNLTSSDGEDGVISYILDHCNIHTSCVEFGAWDGVTSSNTWSLWATRNFSAILIEADSTRFKILRTATQNYPEVVVHNIYLTPYRNSPNSLHSLILDSFGTNSVGVLSVDIDSYDIYFIDSIKDISYDLIIIEYNPTIPPYIEISDKLDHPTCFLSSARAICSKVAQYNQHVLIHATKNNLFFLRKSLLPTVDSQNCDITPLYLEQCFPYQNLFPVKVSTYTNFTFQNKPDPGPVFVDSKGSKKYLILTLIGSLRLLCRPVYLYRFLRALWLY